MIPHALFLFILLALPLAARPRDDSGDGAGTSGRVHSNATLSTGELADYARAPGDVQAMIRVSLALTKRGLGYRYGSCDPAKGAMDCSGTVQYILRQCGFKNPPRDCSAIYLWAKSAGTLRAVRPSSLDDRALAGLRIGDLLFWEGTYGVRRSPPISHVMIYLGREKATGAPVMVGASDGRSYRGKRRNGVSVFDFKLPRSGSGAKFVGYARVPGM